jgi:transposase-like protein
MGRRHSRGEWITICEAFESGGETMADFARRRGVHPATLGWWRTKLRREGVLGGSRNSFVEVVEAQPAAAMHAVVRIGTVTVDFGEGLPPTAWLAELAQRC